MNGLPREFLEWEQFTADSLDFKRTYVDVAGGNLVAGLVLCQIVFWYLPTEEGHTKLRIHKRGDFWIAARREEWSYRLGMSLKQYDSALKVLISRGLIEKKVFKFKGEPTVHIRLIQQQFIIGWCVALDQFTQRANCQNDENEPSDSGGSDSTGKGNPVTENKAENPTESVSQILASFADAALAAELDAEESVLLRDYGTTDEPALTDGEIAKLAESQRAVGYKYTSSGMWNLLLILALHQFGLSASALIHANLRPALAMQEEIRRRRWSHEELMQFCTWHFQKIGRIKGSLPKNYGPLPMERKAQLARGKRTPGFPRQAAEICDYFLYWKNMQPKEADPRKDPGRALTAG